MPKPKPKAGDRFEFVGEPIGNDAGRITTGTVVTIRELVDADTIGAHDDTEDAVVVEWDAPALGVDELGQPTVVYAPRAWSVGAGQFGDLFQKARD